MRKSMLIFMLVSSITSGQDFPQIFQEYIEDVDIEESQLTLFYELLEFPINLNSCKAKDLNQFPFISHAQARAIIQYRKDKGHFQTLYELQAIEEMNVISIKLLLPFLRLTNSKENTSNWYSHQLRIYCQRFLEDEREYLTGEYVGDSFKSYFRYSAQSKRVNWGLTTEKDAGEKWFDFNSAYISMQLKNSRFFLGDYQLSLGQGLLFHQGFGFGKSAQVLGAFKNNPVLRSHTSTRENHFLRGLAMQHHKRNFDFTLWASSNLQDAKLVDSSNIVSAIKDIGLHRTVSDLEDRKQLKHQVFGGCIAFSKNNFTSAVYSIVQNWDKQLVLGQDTLSKQWGIGLNYSWTFKNIHFFGEYAMQQSVLALISGLSIQLSPNLAFSTNFRNFPANYYTLQSNTFGEQSNTRNEKALYYALSFDINSSWNYSFYADHYYFSESSFHSDSPLRGRDYFFQIKHEPSKRWQIYWRLQWERKNNEGLGGRGLERIQLKSQLKTQVHWVYSLGNFRFKNRVAWNIIESEKAYLLFQELSYKPLESKWGLNLRYLLFDSPSFASRIYAYEPDVMYSFYVPFYYGEGQRISTVIKYKFRSLTFNLKLAQTLYYDDTPIKSGSVDGNTLTEIKTALKINF